MSEIFEYRGIDALVFAEVVNDTKEEYKTGEVKELSPVAEIGRTTETSSEPKYYNNNPMLVITSTGADELKLTIAPPTLEILAEITGQKFDAETGAMIEGERETKYFAIGYKAKGTDGKERYVWRFKGTFGIPDETFATENSGTDSNNMELTYTGICTVHKFAKNNNKGAKAIVVDERYAKTDLSTFFDTVTTPDMLQPIKNDQTPENGGV